MDDQVIATYCLTDDFLRSIGHYEAPERAVSDAEVLTVALVAARIYGGNFEAAWRFLLGHGYMTRRLSRGRFGRAYARPSPTLRRVAAGRAALRLAR